MRNMLQFVARLLCVAAFLCLGSGGVWAQADVWDGKAIATDFAGGAGVSGNPYQIATAAQLAYLAQQVNGGNNYDGKYFQLTNDIDLNNHNWIVIDGSFSSSFSGFFDGKGNTISNLGTNPDYNYYDKPIGLFPCVAGATIENLTVIISNIGLNQGCFVGGIAGAVQGNATTTIKNCCVLGGPINAYHPMSDAAAGGIVGAVNSYEETFALAISFCCANVSNITSTVVNSRPCIVGGIIGLNRYDKKVTIQNCASFTTNMKCSRDYGDDCELGGILGKGSVTLSNNYSNPLCLFTKAIIDDENLQEQSSTITKITGGESDNANGAALTTENSKPEGEAFKGWAIQGWTLEEGKLPKISSSVQDIIVELNIRGKGKELDPYQITSVKDMEYIASKINSGATGFNGTEYYRLENDIDLAGKELTAIGTPGNPSKGIKANPFKGTFDGSKHTIKNLRVKNDKVNTTPIGLFGCIESATIKNLGVVISDQGIRDLSPYCETIGGIVGKASGGTISSCFVIGGPINAYKPGNQGYAGGIIGYAEGNVTVSYCYTAVESIFGYVNSAGAGAAGGIIGAFNGSGITIENCLSLTPLYRSGGESGYYKCGRIIAYGTGSPTLTNNFSTPLYLVVGGNEYKTSEKDLTKENFNADSRNALEGWVVAGWTLHDEQLPTLDSKAEGLPIDQFLISGSGTSTAPYQVRNEKDLLFFATRINQGASGYNGTEYYQLVKDLTLSSSEWTPIGTSANPFKGTFDGNNKTITLGIKADANQAQAGLFGTIYTGAKVEKLAVNITSGGITSTASAAPSNAGAIAAINNGTINQCYVTGEGFILSANGTNSYAGGIAGSNSGTISNCYNLIPVKVDNGTTAYAGGIAGHNTGTVKKCFASGEVSTAEKTHATAEAAGGIVGFNDGASSTVVSNCVAVNSKVAVNAGTNAHRVIGTGGNDNDVNNFSHHEMSLVTKAADPYDPLEGTALTKDNANSDADGCFNGWDAAWDLDAIGTYMPKLQGFADGQHSLGIAPYLLYSVTINTVTNGTLTVTRPGSTGGSEEVANNAMVPYNTALTITATPASGYKLKALTVNSGNFTSGTTHTVTDNVTVSATFEADPVDPDPIDPDPTPTPPQPTVYYTVTLPSVEGAATDPVAGDYKVESWSNFRFYLTLDSAYNQSIPVVTTDRGETLTPRQSDGAYILNQVRSDVEIYISGIVKNPDPVANEAIKATAAKVWITNNHLHLQSPVDADAYIYTAAGNQQAICHLTAGQQETIQLPAGIYFIRIGNERFKIRL